MLMLNVERLQPTTQQNTQLAGLRDPSNEYCLIGIVITHVSHVCCVVGEGGGGGGSAAERHQAGV